MKANQIKLGGVYVARVGNKLTRVRVNTIRETFNHRHESRTVYDVTNLVTGRKVTFRSPQRFREKVIQ